MLECGYSKPAKERIAKMQALGMTDDADHPGVRAGLRRRHLPRAAQRVRLDRAVRRRSAFGLVVIWLFLKKYRKPKPLAEIGTIEIDDPALAKYKDQIEKDLANLE